MTDRNSSYFLQIDTEIWENFLLKLRFQKVSYHHY